MIVLAAIGRFFKKIWDWIKQTAWIQPLLIVGIIFGVIFSIPSIVKAIEKGKTEKNTASAYYNRFKFSLKDGENSKADKFTISLGKILAGDEGAEASFKNEFPELGEKFFVTYVDKDCTECEASKDGFQIFEKKLNNTDAYKSNDGAPFHMVTIFADDENEGETTESEPRQAFYNYLGRNLDFFADAGEAAYDTSYYVNGHLSASDLEALETADEENFSYPTIFLVEIGSMVEKNDRDYAGITEVMFGVPGSDKNEKAKNLLDCWNHTDEFGK